MLNGKTVILRPFEEADLEQNQKWINDAEFHRFFLGEKRPLSLFQEKEWYKKVIADRARIFFSIVHVDDQEYIGNAGINNISWVDQTAGFMIYIGNKAYRQKGCAREAARLILRYAFINLNLRKIFLNVSSENDVAINMYRRLGFEKEGYMKNEVFVEGRYLDVLRMALFRGKFVDDS